MALAVLASSIALLFEAGPAVAARQAASATTTELATPSGSGTSAISAGEIKLRSRRASGGRIAVSATATVTAVRRFVAQLAVSPCQSFQRADGSLGQVFEGTPVGVFKQFKPGRNRISVQGAVSVVGPGLHLARRWTDCAVASLLDFEENGPPDVREPLSRGFLFFADLGATTTLSFLGTDGKTH